MDLLDYAVRLRPDGVTGSRFSPVPPVMLESEEGRARALPVDFLGASTPGGRYALPDVCLAAKPDGGGFEVMLARVHHHLLLWSWLSAFQPERERYASVASRWLENDAAAQGLVGLSIRRRNKGFYVYPGRRLVYSVSDVLDVEEGALTPGDVKVLPTPEGPVLVDGQGTRLSLYLPLDDFSSYPPFAALAHPQVLHAPLRTQGSHLPRLSVGGAVYQRERWNLAAERLGKPAASSSSSPCSGSGARAGGPASCSCAARRSASRTSSTPRAPSPWTCCPTWPGTRSACPWRRCIRRRSSSGSRTRGAATPVSCACSSPAGAPRRPEDF